MSTVLVVEHNDAIRKLYALGFACRGHHVVAVSGVGEAKVYLQTRLPDVVLLDLNFQDGSGWELIEHIRGPEQGSEVRIIVATSVDAPVQDVSRLGIDLYLTKPVEIIELLNTIEASEAQHAEVVKVGQC